MNNQKTAAQKGLVGIANQASPEEQMSSMQGQINRLRNEIEELRRHKHCQFTGKVVVELNPFDR